MNISLELRASATRKLAESNEILAAGGENAIDRARTLANEASDEMARADLIEANEARSASLEAVDTSRRPVESRAAEKSETEDREAVETRAYASVIRNQVNSEVRAVLTTTVDATAGHLIPATHGNEIIDVMQKIGPMVSDDIVSSITTPTGADYSVARGDDRANEAYEVAEGTDAPDTDVTFDKVEFKAIEYSTGMVQITRPMLQDDAYGLTAYVNKKFGERLGKLLNKRFTLGNGTTQPQGIVTGLKAASQLVESAATTGFTFKDLLDAEAELEEYYLENAIWMMNRTRLQAFRALADSTGQPSVFQSNYANGAPTTLLGRRFVINNAMANDEIVFGDLKETYTKRMIKGLTVATANELYIKKNTIGVIGFGRFDGRVTNPAAALVLKVKV